MLATSEVMVLHLMHNFFSAIIWTCSLVWLACLGVCCVGIAGQVCSTKVLRGHDEDTMAATTKQSTAAGLPTSTSHYKLMASVGSLPL
jgi:hypothetical protein